MFRYRSVVLMAFLTIVSCKVVSDNSDSNSLTRDSYRISNGEVSGWSEQAADGWIPFTKSTMDQQVDGEAPFYVDGGVIEGAQQILTNSSSENLTIWIMDFPSAEVAGTMYEKIKTDKITVPKLVSGFEESTALINNTSNEGCMVYAVFGQFVIRLSFTNYNDKNKSFTDAAEFLKIYQKR